MRKQGAVVQVTVEPMAILASRVAVPVAEIFPLLALASVLSVWLADHVVTLLTLVPAGMLVPVMYCPAVGVNDPSVTATLGLAFVVRVMLAVPRERLTAVLLLLVVPVAVTAEVAATESDVGTWPTLTLESATPAPLMGVTVRAPAPVAGT
ncbi:unannotated protein [freshwater metagenome]|uniref:Unannotated protein n=1 Tax=freshwater metagenome TaxID=449393 RepID=A0A6J7QBL8_9ZZZZ